MIHNNSNVIAQGIILWDGVTRPEANDGGVMKYSLKIALANNQAEIAEIGQICTEALRNDAKFKGTLPPGGCWPLVPVDAGAFEGRLPAHTAFSSKSNRVPQVFDVNGRELNSMEYGRQLYPGAIVQVLVHAYSFDNKSKGVALGLDGIKIIDSTAPQLPVGGVDASAVFGAAAAAPAASVSPAGSPPPPQYQAPAPLAGVQPAPSFLAPPPAAPVKQMTSTATATYDQYIAAGWTDAQLVQHGFMIG